MNLKKTSLLNPEVQSAGLIDGSITMDDIFYAKSIHRKIRNGILPRYMFKKIKKELPNGGHVEVLEPSRKQTMINLKTNETTTVDCGLTMRLISTYQYLTKR